MSPQESFPEATSESKQPRGMRVFIIGSEAAGYLRFRIECCESFRGELLNGGEGDSHVDRTGLLLWPGSFLLCAYLLSRRKVLVETSVIQHVVELGAGSTGLAGLLLSHLSLPSNPFGPKNPARRRITLTDGDLESVTLLQCNARNHHREADITLCSSKFVDFSAALTAELAVMRLRWGNREEASSLVRGEEPPVSLIIGSDILYPSISQDNIRQLLQCVRVLLLSRNGKEKTTVGAAKVRPSKEPQPRGRFVLSFIDRDNKATLRNFVNALRIENYEVEDVIDGTSLLVEGDEKISVEEEEEVEERDSEAIQKDMGLSEHTRRRTVPMMMGGVVMVLRPLTGDVIGGEGVGTAEHGPSWADRWFRDLWEEAPPCEVEEWEPPLLTDEAHGD